MKKVFIGSVLATLVTLLLGIIATFFIPMTIDTVDLGIEPLKNSHQRPYFTKEELEQSNKEAEARWRQAVEKLSKQSRAQFYQRERLASAWFTWIPWLILPFALRIRSRWIELSALSIPILLTILRILHPYELTFIVIAFGISEVVKYFRNKADSARKATQA